MKRIISAAVLAVAAAIVAIPSAVASSAVDSLGALKGIVVESPDRAPVAHANVVLPEIRLGVMADENGRFEIPDLEPGTYIVRGMMVGCDPIAIETIVYPGKTTDLTIVLVDRAWWRKTLAAMAESTGFDVDVSPEDIFCRLVPAKDSFRVGDRIEFDVRVQNTSRDTVWLIVSTEGVGYGRSYPNVGVTIIGPEGPWRTFQGGIHPRPVLASRADFVELEPGSEFDPLGGRWHAGALADGSFTSPGKHRITFWYSTDEAAVHDWLGGFSPDEWDSDEMSRRIRRVPRMELSCTVEIDVKE